MRDFQEDSWDVTLSNVVGMFQSLRATQIVSSYEDGHGNPWILPCQRGMELRDESVKGCAYQQLEYFDQRRI